MNLGLLDAASIAAVIEDALLAGEDVGDLKVLRRYERQRKGDNLAMLAAFDGLNRLFGLPGWAAPLRQLGPACRRGGASCQTPLDAEGAGPRSGAPASTPLVTRGAASIESAAMTDIRVLSRGALLVALCVSAGPLAAQEQSWNRTLERIASGVVSIQIDSTRSFDTERNQSSQATGFVVDAERGLILTNRHVVTPGPVRAQAVFLNQEEVELQPVYRDPVHDFGFFRYDPSELQFMKPTELALVPEGAQVGRDIRVVGNDAGEQLSILAGTIARLDRQAPNYGRGNYNDFNTFYLQAASGTSGGSSGSPVVDIEGRVVALNAGANSQAASSFFLPLDRIEVALANIQEGDDRPARHAADRVRPQAVRGAAPLGAHARQRSARPRDVSAADRPARRRAGDSGVAGVEQARARRRARRGRRQADRGVRAARGGARRRRRPRGRPSSSSAAGSGSSTACMVEDLHAITPAEYIEYGDGVFHNLSYQQARHFYRPVAGVYVANPGYVFGKAAIPRGSIVTGIGRESLDNLDDLRARARVAARRRASARAIRDVRRAEDRAAAARHERPQLVSGATLPARRRARRVAVPRRSRRARRASPSTPSEGTTFPRQGERHVQAVYAVARARELRHAVHGVGRRRPLLLRHGARSPTPSAAGSSSTATPCPSRWATCA